MSTASATNIVPMLLYVVLLISGTILLMCQKGTVVANDDVNDELTMRGGTQQFFRRMAKWTNLPSGGGALVSGRGNFRPGFHSSTRYHTQLAEPLFAAFKRSPHHLPPVLMDEFQLAEILGIQ